MPTIEDKLTQINHLLAKRQAERPERELEDLIRQLDDATLSEWRPEIEKSIAQFLPKRRKNLSRILESKTGAGNTWKARENRMPISVKEPAPSCPVAPAPELVANFRSALDELRERHIFQWSTFYRDCLAEYLDRFLDEMRHLSNGDSGRLLSKPLADHTRDTFSQGYAFARDSNHGHDEAVRKSLNGLSRFLALPLDFYSIHSSKSSDDGSASALRLLVSAAVSGILEGYSSASFGQKTGSAILPRFQRGWMHYIAFLIPRHAENVVDHLDSGALVDGLRASVLPLLDALQLFHDRLDDEYRPIPVAGQYSWYQRRLDVTVRPPRNASSERLVEVSAFLDDGFVSTVDLDDAARRQITLVIAPLKPDVRKIASERKGLAEIVVPAGQARTEVASRAFKVWDAAIDALRSKWSSTSPITYNFAREFPLHDQNRATVFHVARTSVRDLLRTFERRLGVRLWCSVRRSGKTTACLLDLGSTTGDSIIVSQTCGVTQSQDAMKFYDLVREAVENGSMIPNTFVKNVVSTCAPPIDDENKRLVLVIDEYETLFGLLRTAVEANPSVRHTVVQPIINQLMTFSYDNLLVFLGQQPDAHFILMDQNQLAPYVRQDPFPLFEHAPETTTGEFSELVRKILGERIECTARFMDALFEETAGHPFLTANVLGEFVEWLIEKRRPQIGLRVFDSDFVEFADHKLSSDRIMLSQDYEFFRRAAAEAMSEQGHRDNSWLFTAYWALRELSNTGTGAFRIERAGFPDLMNRIPIPHGGHSWDCNEVLRSASQANFLSYDDDWVRVKIRTLGRIAAAVQPRLT